jgi:hypothetical protein
MPMSRREDRCVRVGVDGQDGAGPAGAGEVVLVAGKADGHVEIGCDAACGDADLSGVRQPAGVGDLACRGHLRAEGGPIVITAARPNRTASVTARRHHGFISVTRPSRASRPSASSARSPRGTCLTSAIVRNPLT